MTSAQASAPSDTPARTSRCGGDLIFAGLILVLAFFLASFPARNTDLWLHLARGRALLDGTHQFGVDPFAAPGHERWVNQSWLADVLLYDLHEALGPAGLAIAKAGLATLIAAILLAAVWHPGPRWLGAFGVALGMVALGPYLELRPVLFSFLGVALTWCWLERRGSRPTLWSAATLLFVFALWANLHAGFLLGPLMVLGWWLGGLLTGSAGAGSGEGPHPAPWWRLGAIALAGAAIALANPHHIHALATERVLPHLALQETAEDGPEALPSDSPLLSPALRADWQGLLAEPNELAFVVLALLSLLSLPLADRQRLGSRLVVWVIFLGLSWQTRAAVPVFALVAGPILGANLQALATRRWSSGLAALPRRTRWLGRLLGLLILTIACAAAWIGWIGRNPGERRRWDATLDPSLEAAGRQFADWHAAGLLPADRRGWQVSASVRHALAWLCPEEKNALDPRDEDARALRAALTGMLPPEQERTWRELLRAHEFTHLIVSDERDRPLKDGLRRLFEASDEWTPIHWRGRCIAFARRNSPSAPQTALGLPGVDLQALAFDARRAERAPPAGLAKDPAPPALQDRFLFERPPPDRAADDALTYRLHFEAQKPAFLARWRAKWDGGLAAALVGAAAPAAAPGGGPVYFRARLLQPDLDNVARAILTYWVRRHDDGPAGDLLLAVRAGRRAVRHDPQDARAHWRLGEAYARLMRGTRERSLYEGFPRLQRVRLAQTAAALQHAVRLDPELAEAHELLAITYRDARSFDVALEHLQAALKLYRRRGWPELSFEAAGRRLAFLEDEEANLAQIARDGIAISETGGETSIVERARRAIEFGVPGRAAQLLADSDAASRGRAGYLLQLELALLRGRTDEVREASDPEYETLLGPLSYHALQAQLAAADGNYDAADFHLQRLAVGEISAPAAIALVLGKHLLDRAGKLIDTKDTPEQLLVRLDSIAAGQREVAEMVALRGLLALEAGDIVNARRLLEQSLALWGSDATAATQIARHYLGMMNLGMSNEK
jgi:tetratricopeptide (TPR) repeat protein